VPRRSPAVVALHWTHCGFGANPLTETVIMLVTAAILLLILWALGLVTSYTLGGLIHILLVVAVVIIIIRVIQGRRI
jgi:Family of unknown function (DUF5670)